MGTMPNLVPKKKSAGTGSSRAATTPVSIPIFAAIFIAFGYYLGSQRQLIQHIHDSSSLSTPSSFGPPPPEKKVSSSTSKNQLANGNTNANNVNVDVDAKARELQNGATPADGVFRIHPYIEIPEDPELYKKLVYPPVRTLVESGTVVGCPLDPVKPYLEILQNIEGDPLFYEDSKNATATCPVVFLFYFEGMSKIADVFFDFYSNIESKRCLNFIVSGRWISEPGTKEMAAKHGYKIIGKNMPKQDKTISTSLWDIQRDHGENVLVSVNDLDHLMVWFDDKGQPHRYSSYTDMVRLYAYELLTTKGCSNQNVQEKYVVPCTCLMENNQKYVSVTKDHGGSGVIWSEYGTNNRFHPTGNFYLNKSQALPSDGDSNYVYSIGTVFANLRKYDADIITHHKIGWRTKKVFSRAKMTGVIHARSDNMIQSLTKYQHFLANSMKHNIFRDEKATLADAMGCSVVDTHGILRNEKTCRTVKEFANILSIGHQKLACLNAGYSEEHCASELSCCLTY